MAFFKAFQLDSNKKWYPKAVQVDQPFTTKELADALAEISTVSYADAEEPGTGEDTGSDGSFG